MLARKSALIVLVNVLGGVLGLVALKFIALTGTEPIGRVGFALAIVGPFELIGDLGFNRAYLKRVSEGKDLATAKATFRRLKLILIAAMVLVVLTALFVWTELLGRPLVDVSAPLIGVALLYAALRALVTVPNLLFDARRETAKSQLAVFAEHVVRVPAVVLASLLFYAGAKGQGPLVAFPPAWTAYAAAHIDVLLGLTYALGAAATLGVGLWLGRHYPSGHPSRAFAADMWRFGRPLLLVSIVAALASYVDRQAIGFFGSPTTFDGATEVGYYFTAQRMTLILQTVPLAVSTLLLPTVSERHAALDRAEVLRVTTAAERYTTLFVAPAIVFFAVIPGPIINVFLSAAFRPAAPTLALLSIYALILGLFNLHVSLLAGMDQPRLQARSAFIAFVLNAALVLLLVPDHGWHLFVPIRGAVGAALATILAFSASLAYLMFHAWRLAGKRPSLHVLVQLGIAALLAIVLRASLRLHVPARAFELPLYAAAFFLAYVALLFATRQLTADELRTFWHAVDPRRFSKYVRDELRSRP